MCIFLLDTSAQYAEYNRESNRKEASNLQKFPTSFPEAFDFPKFPTPVSSVSSFIISYFQKFPASFSEAFDFPQFPTQFSLMKCI